MTLARDRLVAWGMEGTAFADEVSASARRIGMAVSAGAAGVAMREASHLTERASGYRNESRRLSGAFEHRRPRGGSAA